MAEFKQITDLKQLEEWLLTQDVRMSRAIATRAALRSLPALMAVSDQTFDLSPGTTPLWAGLRTSLIAGVASTCPTRVMRLVASAAIPALSATLATRTAALSDPLFDVLSAARFALSDDAALSNALSDDAATFQDADTGQNLGSSAVFTHQLWPDTKAAAPLLALWEAFETRPDPDGTWRFWRDWYRGMLIGNPLDWDLQLQVALIEDGIWKFGPEAVAKEIARIRQGFRPKSDTAPDRFPEHEPTSVNHQIENRIVATTCLQGLSVQISEIIERYHAETGANALPDALTPLSDMPQLLNTLADTLRSIPESGTASSDTVQQLREENGRLNAKITELQGTIAALKSEIFNLSEPEKKNYWKILRNVALIGGLASVAPTLAGGAWALSGDELGLKQRYENLILDWEFVKTLSAGEISPSQGQSQTQVEKSLRPVTRTGRA